MCKCAPASNVRVARKMQTDIERRFQFVISPYSSAFDPLYVAATFLNPAYKGVLDEQQVLKAKQYLLTLMNNRIPSTNVELEEIHPQQSTETSQQSAENEQEPPTKRFKHLNRLSKVLEKEAAESNTDEESFDKIPKQEQEIISYLNMRITKEDLQQDPFDLWLKKESEFPNLASIALDLLSTPASSAAVKRIFSSGGEATRGRRNRLQDENLEREIFLRTNKMYI